MKQLLILLLLVILISSYCNENVLTIACEDKEVFPSLMGKGDQLAVPHPGLAPEMLNMVASELNLKIIYIRIPWQRGLEIELKNGSVDAIFGASYKKEREEFGLYPLKDEKPDESKQLYTTAYSFYKGKNKKMLWDGKSLQGFKGVIGVPRGYSIGDDLRAKGYRIEETDYALLDIKKVAAGRIDICAELEPQGDYILENNPDLAKTVEKMEPPITSKPYYLMFSRQFSAKNRELVIRFWNTLQKVREENYKKLLQKYLK